MKIATPLKPGLETYILDTDFKYQLKLIGTNTLD